MQERRNVYLALYKPSIYSFHSSLPHQYGGDNNWVSLNIDQHQITRELTITVAFHRHHGDPNNRQVDGLFSILFRTTTNEKTPKLHITGPQWGIHQGPVHSPHRGLSTRKAFPCHDVIMGSHEPCAYFMRCTFYKIFNNSISPLAICGFACYVTNESTVHVTDCIISKQWISDYMILCSPCIKLIQRNYYRWILNCHKTYFRTISKTSKVRDWCLEVAILS